MTHRESKKEAKKASTKSKKPEIVESEEIEKAKGKNIVGKGR
ncbi:hypothetical protein [Clostridium sp. 19966]|nr:hypothetical protein [Clostridium sp. 19966]